MTRETSMQEAETHSYVAWLMVCKVKYEIPREVTDQAQVPSKFRFQGSDDLRVFQLHLQVTIRPPPEDGAS